MFFFVRPKLVSELIAVSRVCNKIARKWKLCLSYNCCMMDRDGMQSSDDVSMSLEIKVCKVFSSVLFVLEKIDRRREQRSK